MRNLSLSPDGRLLFLTSGLRNVAYGFVSVTLGLYLAALGLGTPAIGGVFTAALAGGAAMTVIFSLLSSRLGRRRVLLVSALLMALAGATYALTANVLVLSAAAAVGTISPSGKEVGPFLSLEQAILPQTAPDEQRTGLFAAYNLVGSLSSAFGALIAAGPHLLGVSPVAGGRLLLWAYAVAALLLLLLYTQLSPKAEVAVPTGAAWRGGIHQSRGIVAKLALLFAVDSFAGAFVVQSLVAYWLHARFGVDIAALGAIFFGVNLCAALSFLAAAPLARRIGLLNTMVITHLPSNVLLILVAFMPNAGLAIAVLLLRSLLSQMDVPTRQSYTMAVVAPEERAAVAGVTSVARSAAAAAAPAFAGATLAFPALGLPFLIAGSLKIAYDLAILATFRHVRPPEEHRTLR
jgi:MFS family permease